ncbi:MAG: carbohydrate ABC transporter permease [Candidatus Sumerlaeaceae bacterium]
MNRARVDNAWRKFAIYLFLVLMAAAVVFPMAWMFATSFKDARSIFRDPWAFPEKLQFSNYSGAWTKGAMGLKFLNSLAITAVALMLILLISAMAAYVIARFRFPGSSFLYYMFLAGLAVPIFLAIMPLFRLMDQLRLLDTRVGLVLAYVAYSLAFTIFVLTGFFRTLPSQLAEAAAMDGASPSRTFWRVMFPLSKPGLVAAGIFVGIGLWNEYPLALVLITTDNLQTLPLGIASLTMTQRYQSDWGALFAVLAIAVIPTLLAYALFQRQIEQGFTAGALKG